MQWLQRFWSKSGRVLRRALEVFDRARRLGGGGWERRVHALGGRSFVLVPTAPGRGSRKTRPRRIGYAEITSLRVEHVDLITYEDWFLVVETGVGRFEWIDLDAPRSSELLELLATRFGFDPATCPGFFAMRELGSVVLFARDLDEVALSVEPHDRRALQ